MLIMRIKCHPNHWSVNTLLVRYIDTYDKLKFIFKCLEEIATSDHDEICRHVRHGIDNQNNGLIENKLLKSSVSYKN